MNWKLIENIKSELTENCSILFKGGNKYTANNDYYLGGYWDSEIYLETSECEGISYEDLTYAVKVHGLTHYCIIEDVGY